MHIQSGSAGGALQYVDAASGVWAEAQVRTLVAHGDAAYREWGAGASVRLDPGTAGRALTLSGSPAWGAASTGGAKRLWSVPNAGDLARDSGLYFDEGARIRADVGYGLSAFRRRGAMTPFAGLYSGSGNRDVRMGVRWSRGMGLAFGVQGLRRESATAPVDHGIVLQAVARW